MDKLPVKSGDKTVMPLEKNDRKFRRNAMNPKAFCTGLKLCNSLPYLHFACAELNVAAVFGAAAIKSPNIYVIPTACERPGLE